jgi:hypothetical protein
MAQSKARRAASILGLDYSSCIDRGPNRWEDVEDEDEETETDDHVVETPIHETRLKIVKKQNDIFRSMGIVPSGDYVSTGCATENNVRLRNESFEKLPCVDSLAMLKIAEVIRDEDRQDFILRKQDIRLNRIGELYGKMDGMSKGKLEDQAFAQFLARVGSSKGTTVPLFKNASQCFRIWETDIMVDTFNTVMNRYDGKHWNGDLMVIGTRNNTKTGSRTIYRVVSTSYEGSIDGADILEATHEAIMKHDPQAKCVVTYDPKTTRTQIDIIWQKEHKVKNPNDPMAAGSVFRFGIRVTTADAANHRYLVEAIAYRDGCDNCMIIGEEKGILIEKRHIGDVQNIDLLLADAIDKAMKQAAPFLKDWGYLSGHDLTTCRLFGKRFASIEEALKYAVKEGKLGKKESKKLMLDALLNGWEKEKGFTLDYFVNAITRAAHDSMLNDMQREKLEREAGQLIPIIANWARRGI